MIADDTSRLGVSCGGNKINDGERNELSVQLTACC